jgi:hypothetical protein
MKIQENLNITDSKIRGVVVIKNADGTIILKKENMIVQSGREFIMDKFSKAAGIGNFSTAYTGTYTSYSLTHIGFGNSDVASQYSMESLVSENTAPGIRQVLSVDIVEKSSTGTPFLKFKAGLNLGSSASGYELREIGLLMSIATDTNPITYDNFTLFSRVVFDTIPIIAGENYEVEYYIYF